MQFQIYSQQISRDISVFSYVETTFQRDGFYETAYSVSYTKLYFLISFISLPVSPYYKNTRISVFKFYFNIILKLMFIDNLEFVARNWP